jgi:hypothetical protein
MRFGCRTTHRGLRSHLRRCREQQSPLELRLDPAAPIEIRFET